MNKEVASVLKNHIKGLPFVDVIAGMVQVVKEVKFTDNQQRIENRFPVSYEVAKAGDAPETATCLGAEKELIPNSNKKSLIYFEDFGTVPAPGNHGLIEFVSSIRLVAWFNKLKLVNDRYAEITAPAISAILEALPMGNPINRGIFTRFRVMSAKIQPQNAAIFAPYTYNEAETQYLRPPFEFFALDLVVKYTVSPKCIEKINWNQEPTCS